MRDEAQSGGLCLGANRGEGKRRCLVIVAIAAVLLLLAAPLVWGGTYQVTNTLDNTQTGSLRWAIDHCQTDDTIVFNSSVFDNATDGTILLASALSPLKITTPYITIDGSGAVVTIDAGTHYTAFEINSTASNVTIENLTIQKGAASVSINSNYYGGGICDKADNFTLEHCTVSGCSAQYGGAGMYCDGANLTVEDCAFETNKGPDYGGAIYNASGVSGTVSKCTFTGNKAYYSGGAMYNLGAGSNGTLSVTGCTFSDNTAGGINAAGCGGAVCVDGGLGQPVSSVSFTNCTFSGNEALYASSSEGYGGAMYVNSGCAATLTYCTLTDNTASGYGGGYYGMWSSNTSLGATIVVGNHAATDPDIYTNDSPNVTSEGYNFVGPVTDPSDFEASGDQTGVPTSELGLDSLADNAGPSVGAPNTPTITLETCALLPGSMAIDAVPAASTQTEPFNVENDARNEHRPYPAAGNADVGAFESQGFTIQATGGTPQTTSINTLFPEPLVVTVSPNIGGVSVAGGTVTFAASASGASATFAPPNPVTIVSGGIASVAATANDTVGTYEVTATTVGANSTASFHLANIVPQSGDVNGDGVINILDVRLCQEIAQGVIQGTAAQRQQADVDGDGQVTLTDAQLLADYVLGILQTLP